MSVTNREAEQWNRVAKAAADRRLREAREAAIARILARPPEPLSMSGYGMPPAPAQRVQEQRGLFDA